MSLSSLDLLIYLNTRLIELALEDEAQPSHGQVTLRVSVTLADYVQPTVDSQPLVSDMFLAQGEGQRLDDEAQNIQDENQIRLRFEVIDTGVGISTEDMDKIFEPFELEQLDESYAPFANKIHERIQKFEIGQILTLINQYLTDPDKK